MAKKTKTTTKEYTKAIYEAKDKLELNRQENISLASIGAIITEKLSIELGQEKLRFLRNAATLEHKDLMPYLSAKLAKVSE